jgi:AraC-like DNA-binding protein
MDIMFYQEYQAPGILKNYVRCIWIQEQEYNEKASFTEKERILPDGCVELVFHFGKPFNTYFSDQSCSTQPWGFIITQMNHYIELQPTQSIGLIAVRFFPWGGYRFLGTPISDIHDKVIDVELLWHQQYRDIHNRICEARSHKERLKIVENFLYSRLSLTQQEDPLVEQCLKEIHHSEGQQTVQLLSHRYGISKRQLERRFMNTVGSSPKHFSRITRFLNASKRMRMQERPYTHLAQIAQDSGYFDQSHFIREFKGFSGMTPKAFLADTQTSFVDL